MNQMERAASEDWAGQQVLRAAERAETYKKVMQRMKEMVKDLNIKVITAQQPRPLRGPVPYEAPKSDLVIIDYISELRMPPSMCSSEDAHDFDSTGQCRRCGAHRRPA